MSSKKLIENSDKHPVIDLMRNEQKKWAASTKFYGALNPFFRIYLIIVSALVAAEKTIGFDDSPVKFLITWIPILAVTVTIIAGLDAWLMPRDKWSGFMKDRDDLDKLINEGLAALNSDPNAPLLDINDKFHNLRERHREENVF